jgi:hypothetical protein
MIEGVVEPVHEGCAGLFPQGRIHMLQECRSGMSAMNGVRFPYPLSPLHFAVGKWTTFEKCSWG